MEQTKNKNCLYFHYKSNGEIFYVGIGKPTRAYDFVNARNYFWHNVVKKHGLPIVKIILENMTWEDACTEEIRYIKLYGRRNLGLGTLVNLTDGGDGVSQWGTHEERSTSAKNRYIHISQEQINLHAEKMRNSRTHEQMSIGAKKRWLNKTEKEKSDYAKNISEKAIVRLSKLSPREKSTRSYKSKETMGSELRSLAAKKGKMSMTPEQRSTACKKSWETRRKKNYE